MPNPCRHGAESGAYVLDALQPAERDAFEQHLTTCASCRDEVGELRVAADALPLAADELEPPADLRRRVMSIVGDEAAVRSATAPEADRRADPARTHTRAVDAPWWRRPLALQPLPAAALAAVLLGLGVSAGALVAGGGKDRERVVTGRVAGGRGQAQVVTEDGRGRLLVRAFPAAPNGKVYEVWTQEVGAPAQATDALFRTSSAGTASVDVPGPLHGVQRLMVTAEPDGGSHAPTSPPVVVATLR